MRSASHQSDEWEEEEDEQRRGSRKHSFQRKRDSRDKAKTAEEETEETEDYWFVCRRWFAKGEDDGKIVRELLPTDEHGHPIDTGLEGGCRGVMVGGGKVG